MFTESRDSGSKRGSECMDHLHTVWPSGKEQRARVSPEGAGAGAVRAAEHKWISCILPTLSAFKSAKDCDFANCSQQACPSALYFEMNLQSSI